MKDNLQECLTRTLVVEKTPGKTVVRNALTKGRIEWTEALTQGFRILTQPMSPDDSSSKAMMKEQTFEPI